MAHSMFNQFRYAKEANVVELFAEIAIGATGAPTLSRGKGIKSVTRNSAGDYTLTLQENFSGLLQVNTSIQNATGISAAPDWAIKNNSVTAATPTIELVCSNNSGSATDPASGDTVRIQLVLRNSSL